MISTSLLEDWNQEFGNHMIYSFLLKCFASEVNRSGGCGVVKRLACGASGLGFNPRFPNAISEIGYLLLPSRNITETLLRQCKFLKINQPNSEVNIGIAHGLCKPALKAKSDYQTDR